MPEHPYRSISDYASWSRAIGRVDPSDVDPVVRGKFKVSKSNRVVTAGSCFAQHIARRLAASGFNFHVTEKPHPLMDPDLSKRYGYGLFSARYGNIYTSRQLLQLLQRALGEFKPAEAAWEKDGRYYDPFRPGIQPNGFVSLRELGLDRAQHLRAVRHAFSEMEVFVFTLGLTEVWVSRQDGAAFPTCPGVTAGEFDPLRYALINLGVDEVLRDMSAFVALARTLNPQFKMILTVSPVPLAATAVDQHVLTATTYSKSVLRVVASMAEAADPDRIAYFPSYEIITGSYAKGAYYASDLRNVVETGVDHVMNLFFRHYTDAVELAVSPPRADEESALEEMKRVVEVQCEEAMLDVGLAP